MEYRYFEVTDGPVLDRIAEIDAANDAAKKHFIEIINELGGNDEKWLTSGEDRSLVGVFFDTPRAPGHGEKFKRVESGAWYPKRNSKWGRDIHKRIKAIETISPEEALSLLSLKGKRLILNSRMASPSLNSFGSPRRVLVTVPWYDEDPMVLAAYRQKKDQKDSTLNHLLWEPTSDMVEIKRWEFHKIIDEHNAAIGKREAEENDLL
jgi:hypothetical protein